MHNYAYVLTYVKLMHACMQFMLFNENRKFMEILERFVGSKDRQKQIINKQQTTTSSATSHNHEDHRT
jgi:hypothetical protein